MSQSQQTAAETSQTAVLPVCADCHHLRINPKSQRHGPVCASSAFACDPVTGEPEKNCAFERISPDGSCGPEGKLFLPRDQSTYVVWVSRSSPLLDSGYTR